MKSLYELGPIEFGESDKYDYYTSVELMSYGDTLDELLDNACYSYIDQDGGEVDTGPADDNQAIDFIEEWYRMNKCPECEPPKVVDELQVYKNWRDNQ